MFHHPGALEQLLAPAAYHAADFHARELETIFAPQWHFACPAEHVQRQGEQVARSVRDVPVVIRRGSAGLRAFVNVCAHRHTTVAPPGRSCADVLRCPYHGWEYRDDGRVGRIPDAASFRGQRGGPLGLPELAVEQLGDLVFVNLSQDPEPLRASLGEFAEEIDEYFGGRRLIWSWTTEHDVNWKVIAENAVESYHVPFTHPDTFQQFRDESLHDHVLDKRYTRYRDLKPWGERPVERALVAAARLMLPGRTLNRFTQAHLFPNHLCYYSELFSTYIELEPLGPTRTRHVQLGFVPRDLPSAWWRRPLQQAFSFALVRGIRGIMREDMALWPRIQAGLERSPHEGVLSAREERVHAFQRFVLESTAGADG